MSCGLPILCSNVCDNATIVEKGVNGLLFNPNDISDMAASMHKFIDSSAADKKRMGCNSRNIALKKFAAEQFVNQYEKLF
jgi:glycosyltransferase involved in cell wall biosynthesis